MNAESLTAAYVIAMMETTYKAPDTTHSAGLLVAARVLNDLAVVGQAARGHYFHASPQLGDIAYRLF